MLSKWISVEGTVAFPIGWQVPAKTELWVYEELLKLRFYSKFAQIVCYPWATLFDLLKSTRKEKADYYLNALSLLVPRSTLIRATVCQHIEALSYIPLFKKAGITDIYWCHATADSSKGTGLRFHPFPLYPVRCEDFPDVVTGGGLRSAERDLLFSFVGAYVPGLYKTPVRQWIFELPVSSRSHIERRRGWHYEQHVYGQQIEGVSLTKSQEDAHELGSITYSQILSKSKFSLCPSGSGPNSIRLWESLGYGCIPVLISDDLLLPGDEAEWADAMVKVPETKAAVREIPERLNELARNSIRLTSMQSAGRKIWYKYCVGVMESIFGNLRDPKWVRETLLKSV